MVHYDSCPICGSPSLSSKFSAKDHTVTGNNFVITACRYCTGLFTQDVPEQEEIGAYYKSENYISHSDTKRGLVNNLYHKVRAITLKGKRDLVQKITNKKSGNILDLGAGTGAFLNTMKEAGWNINGLEPDEAAKKIAKEQYNLEMQPLDEFFDLPHEKFDAITMWHVLEHVHQLHQYMDKLKHLLNASGKLFIAVPNYTSKDAQYYKSSWAAYDVPRHLYHFSPKSMELLVEKHGMHIVTKKRMWFDSYYVSMLSEKYKTGKDNHFIAALVGLYSNFVALFNKDKCSSVIYVIGKNG